MADVNQDFNCYQGNNVSPVFTMPSGVDLSSVQEIKWVAMRKPSDTPILTKLKSLAQIILVGSAPVTQFQVLILPADTTPLSGNYYHSVLITDSVGDITTVAIGTMNVGPLVPSATYSGDPNNSTLDAVRFYLQDTDTDDAKFSDSEINYVLSNFPSPLGAAAQMARTLAGQYASKVNKRVGDLSINYGDLYKNYAALAASLQMQADTTGVSIYAGGVSKSDMKANRENTDRNASPFRMDQFDNKGASGGFAPPNQGAEGEDA